MLTRPASDAAPVTGTGRVWGASASSAPSSTTLRISSSSISPTSSRQNDRHRMLGSIPCSSTTSLPFGSRAHDTRVVGQVMPRVSPSVISTMGRVTWKS